jgi:hypothetical protein
MEMTQQDYDERKTKTVAEEGSDEDLRLVKLYEREGFTPSPRGDEQDYLDEELEEDAPYIEWSFEDLKSEAGRRKLSKAGGREDVIARLEANDAAEAQV